MTMSEVQTAVHPQNEAGETFPDRLDRIMSDITLPENFKVRLGFKQGSGLWFFQIECLRKDVITGEMGWGHGGKAYLSPHASDSELVQTIFGLYLRYVEHEARESFEYKGKRIFGPHISVEALLTVASKVDIRGAQHIEDRA